MAAYRKYTTADLLVVNLGTYLMDCMDEFGDAIAVVDGNTVTGKSLTYRQFRQRIERAAAGLQKIGMAKGDVICFVSPNHIDYLVACYAACLVSAVCQPVNPTYTKDDISKSVKNCNTKFIITIPELLPVVKAGIAGNDAIKVIVFGEAPGCIPFEYLLDPAHGQYRTPPIDPKTAVSLLLSSSGTTGFPKAAIHTHFTITTLITQMKWSNGVLRLYETMVLFLPLYHVYGLAILAMSAHAMGGKVVLMSKFEPDNYLRLIAKHRPRLLTVAPPVMVMLAKHPKVSEYDLSSVKEIVCGAAPLSPKVEEVVKERLNLKLIHQGFGMTEVFITHINTDTEYRDKSVGKLMPLVETKIADVDTGKTLGPNEEGELVVRGPQVCLGYLNMPRETSEMFLKDGWVRTGDVGMEDEDGFLYIVDRIKELIKYKAFQVAPATLEDILLHHDKVVDVGVVGVPDEEAGELPRAYVVKQPGTQVTAEELINFVAAKVPPHMKLRGGVDFEVCLIKYSERHYDSEQEQTLANCDNQYQGVPQTFLKAQT